jgi:hypothetical protein
MLGMTPRMQLGGGFPSLHGRTPRGGGTPGGGPSFQGFPRCAQAAAAEPAGSTAIGVTVAPARAARSSSQRSNSSGGIAQE